MSMLGERFRFVVWNASNVALPQAGVVVRYKRGRPKLVNGVVETEWEATPTAITLGASMASGSGEASAVIQNNTEGARWMFAQVFATFPTLGSNGSGPVEVWLQRSSDDGTNWVDTPNLRGGLLLVSQWYDAATAGADKETLI